MAIKSKPSFKRLSVDLPVDIHAAVKAHAAINQMSVQDFVASLINSKLGKSKK